MTKTLTFDTVIATRNRPEALALSIPLILGQSRQPEKLIIIDSSDDHETVESVVGRAVEDWPGEVILRASERGSSLQRNIGLDHVTADVVFFPDDDSMLHPGTTEAIMRAYGLDWNGKIAGVCAADAATWTDSYLMGVMQVMNRSYICEKAMHCHSFSQREERQIRKYLSIFLALKITQSAVRISIKSSREQLRGMLHSTKHARRLRSASYEDLASLYAVGLSQLSNEN